jgi:hypothetical protein
MALDQLTIVHRWLGPAITSRPAGASAPAATAGAPACIITG